MVAWDGTALDVPDSPENAATFGFTGRDGTNKSGNPQVRLMALIECGTHAVIDAAFDSIARFSEHKLARRLLASMRPGILLLADRNFAGHELWGLVEATGCHLAWRIKKNLVLPPLWVLPDGSYVSVMPTPAQGQRLGNARFQGRTPTGLPEGHLVRIIDYTVTVRPQYGPVQVEKFRLATSLLNHRQVPARQAGRRPGAGGVQGLRSRADSGLPSAGTAPPELPISRRPPGSSHSSRSFFRSCTRRSSSGAAPFTETGQRGGVYVITVLVLRCAFPAPGRGRAEEQGVQKRHHSCRIGPVVHGLDAQCFGGKGCASARRAAPRSPELFRHRVLPWFRAAVVDVRRSALVDQADYALYVG
ncbi:transposase [Streptomyces sp. NPDC127105]|uniref:transposase n=1 Tax=Streptomyces sp. NPDC127105 TaxID=3345359 RepID=UPI00365B8FEB